MVNIGEYIVYAALTIKKIFTLESLALSTNISAYHLKLRDSCSPSPLVSHPSVEAI